MLPKFGHFRTNEVFKRPGSRLVMFSLKALFLLGLVILSYGCSDGVSRCVLESSLSDPLRFLSEPPRLLP